MCLLGIAACAGSPHDGAELVTFSEHVVPILSQHCAVCHHPSGPAPFSLLTFDDARAHDEQIVAATTRRDMPPWLPETGTNRFAGERRLTDDEIATLQRWVDHGTLKGGTAEVPPPARGDWRLGTPDLVLSLPEGYTLPAAGHDVFRNFVVPVPVPSPRYVRAVEFRPGRPRTIHHLTLMVDRTRSSRRLDDADPLPGYSGMDASRAHSPGGHFVGWTPGKVPALDAGAMPWRLDPGTDIVLQLHMLPRGRPEPIGLTVGFHLTDTPPSRSPAMIRLGSRTIDIPAGEAHHRVTDEFRLPVAVEVLSVYPHAHFLAREMKAWATLPDGTERVLIHIRQWDFNWQDEYRYRQPLQLPRGTVLSMEYVYDNSAANPQNPHAPPSRVVYGPQSTDEMGDLWLQVLPARAADLALLDRAFLEKDLIDDLQGAEARVARDTDDADAHYQLGTSYLTLGRTADGETHLRHAIRATGHADAHYALGVLLADRGELPAAIDHLRRAVAAEPRNADFHFSLGNVLQTAGRPDEGLEQLQRAVALAPDHASAHNNLGLALAAQGHVTRAIDHLRRALVVRADDATLHFNLGTLLRAVGETDDAMGHFRETVTLDPRHADAHNNLAVELGARGQLDEAIGHLRQALAANPDHADAHNNLGAALVAMGQLAAAREQFRLALAANPDHQDARANLRRLAGGP